MANKNSLLKSLTSVLLCRDKTAGGGSSTLDGAVAKGATAITLASAVNFAVGDTVRVGSGSSLELVTLAAGAVSPIFNTTEPIARAHASGEAVVEQDAFDLGDITDAGVDTTLNRESTDVAVATKRLVYAVLLGYADFEASFVLPSLSMENIAFALGMPISAVSGTGASSTNPKGMVTDLLDISSELNASLVCTGLLMDGTPVRVELWSVDPDYSGFSINLRRGTLAGVPCRFIATAGGRVSNNASVYVANTTYRASKGKVFDGLSEVGVFAALGGGASTTVAAPAGGSNVAGQKVLTLASAAGVAAGDWLKLGTEDTVEFHRVSSVAGADVTLNTKLLRTQATGTAVVEQTLVPFGNISPDGVTLAFTGTIDRLREATQIMSIGTRPGSARAAVSFGILDYTVAALARAAGIDPATIVGNTLVLDEALGTAVTEGVYARGVLKDGSTVWMTMWGCSQDVSRTAIRLASTGEPSVPTSWVPASGLALMNHV